MPEDMKESSQKNQDRKTEDLKSLGQYIGDTVPHFLKKIDITKHHVVLWTDRSSLVKLMLFLRDDGVCLFKQLIELCGVDYPERQERFEIVYHLLSLKQNQRIMVKLTTDEETPVPSITSIFSAANWLERETWDMYGVKFEGHTDLRRLLTDYNFVGHPLRKDFPLTGFVEMRYDEVQKRVIYEPVALRQDFRNFDFESPWEGMSRNILPGDEKAIEIPLNKESA